MYRSPKSDLGSAGFIARKKPEIRSQEVDIGVATLRLLVQKMALISESFGLKQWSLKCRLLISFASV